MKTAVIGTSKKENEKRVPIHPNHISLIPADIRKQLVFQTGYGVPFGMDDETITALTGNPVADRDTLMQSFDAIIITKPVADDFACMRRGALVWGWIHAVQQFDVAQAAIDSQLTLVAWEHMYHKTSRDRTHIFYRNNEMAGYCGVQHALEVRGIDGNYGPPRNVNVLSMGSVSRGAIYALKGHGFTNITVYTRRPPFLAGNRIPGVRYKQLVYSDADQGYFVINHRRKKSPLIQEMAQADIIVNGMLQNPKNPVILIHGHDIGTFKKQCLIIDISCDIGMGFSFAQPTDFSHPVLRFGNILYYAVDHTPTLLWDSASWEISHSILPYLGYLLSGEANGILSDATDIQDGMILNQDIIAFQNRRAEFPYDPL